jgi:hypothetical protein
MRNNTEATCYGSTVGNQSHPHLPMLISPTEPTAFLPAWDEDDDKRSLRLLGRSNVRLSKCGGPCVSSELIERAFAR